MNLAMRLEERYAIEVPEERLARDPSVDEIVALVHGTLVADADGRPADAPA